MRRAYNVRILLNPRRTWRDCDTYERQSRQVAQKFHAHVTPLSYDMDEAVREADSVIDSILLA